MEGNSLELNWPNEAFLRITTHQDYSDPVLVGEKLK